MRSLRLALAAVTLALSCTGCVILPFATPPMRVSLGGSGRFPAPPHDPLPGEAPPGPAFSLRAGIHPLQLDRHPRNADAGIGYILDAGKGPLVHGVYLEGAVFPINEGQHGRVGIHAQPRFLYDASTGRGGGGLGLQLSGEFARFTDRPFSSHDAKGGATGYAYGEGAIGLYLEGSYSRLGRTAVGSLGGGLIFRLPATFGVAWGVK